MPETANPPPSMMTPEQVATLLQITTRTLRQLVLDGKFPDADLRIGARIVRWKRETVESAIEALTPDLSDLLINDELGFRIPLLNAPIVAAMWVAAPDQLVPAQWNQHVDLDISRRELLFELRRMRASAPRWYDKCLELTLLDALGRRRHEIFGAPQ